MNMSPLNVLIFFNTVPTAPINVRVEGTKPNAIALRWDAPAVMGVLTNYTIYVTDESGAPMVLAVDPPVNNYVLYDLVEGTRYTIMVSAFSDNGESPKSMPLEVMTDSYSKFSGSIFFYWKGGGGGGYIALSYNFQESFLFP